MSPPGVPTRHSAELLTHFLSAPRAPPTPGRAAKTFTRLRFDEARWEPVPLGERLPRRPGPRRVVRRRLRPSVSRGRSVLRSIATHRGTRGAAGPRFPASAPFSVPSPANGALANRKAAAITIGAVPELHVLRVFTDDDGAWGNPLGIFLEGPAVPEADRLRIAAELGFSETVFVDDRRAGRIRIYTPAVELPFAGHPTVGTAWLLARVGMPVETLRPPAGDLPVRVENDGAHVEGRPEWSPYEDRQAGSPAEVESLSEAPEEDSNIYVWAWIDEAAGTIRARGFAPAAGIEEDEASGSAALALSAKLGRPIKIHQGRGSVLLARPTAEGRAEVGGNVRLAEVREFG